MNWIRTFLTATTEAAQETTQANPMKGFGDILPILMLMILIGGGGYFLYTAIRLRCTYMLTGNKILYPGNCKPEDCLDEDGFIDYILPRLTILSVGMVVSGIVLALNTYLFKLGGMAAELAMVAVPFGLLVWYMFIQNRAAKRFWGV